MKNRMIRIGTILFFIGFFTAAIWITNSKNKVAEDRVLQDSFYGVVIDKKILYENHNLRVAYYTSLDDSSVDSGRVILPQDASVIYDFIEIGDTLRKDMNDSTLVVQSGKRFRRINMLKYP